MLVFVRKYMVGAAARSWVGLPAAAAFLMAVEPVAAQECETDADCGFGFHCYSETLVGGTSTTGTTGAGGGWSGSGGANSAGFSNVSSDGSTGGEPNPTCGDDLCVYGETWESCPADCERYTYCAGATCESDSDCAPNYTCQAGGNNTSGGSSGTTSGSGSFCGDGICDGAEAEQGCASDCSTTCQRLYLPCNADAECPSGYYCDRSQPGGSVGVTSSSGGEVYEWYDGTCSVVGTTGGSGGGHGSGGAGGSGGAVGTEGGDTDAGETDGTSNDSTTGDPGTTAGSVSAAASGNGSDGTSSTGSGGSAGHQDGDDWHHWPPRWARPRGGCSMGAGLGHDASLPVAFAAALAWVVARRRRSPAG